MARFGSGIRAAAVVVAMFGSASPARAQADDALRLTPRALTASPKAQGPGPMFHLPQLEPSGRLTVPPARISPSPVSSNRARQNRSLVQRILWTTAAGAGGFFGGGFLGAAIEGDSCNCDDPGFKGFLIGAPIGAAVGSILGWRFSR